MTNEPPLKLLLIEDDLRLAQLTREYLEANQIEVALESSGERGLRLALGQAFDAVLLDLMLPDRDGITICQRLREHSDVPILIVTARGEEADRVLGLEIGADDYLPKPFSPRELLARVRAAVRRHRGQAGPRAGHLRVEDLTLDPGRMTAHLGQTPLDLTSYEFALLQALAERAGQVLSRERLMELARGSADDAFDRSIDVHISRLRAKLGDNPRDPQRIRTVRGVGYQYLTRSQA